MRYGQKLHAWARGGALGRIWRFVPEFLPWVETEGRGGYWQKLHARGSRRYIRQMKYALPVLLISLVLLSSCAGQPGVPDRTRVISIGYHSEDCVECEVLQGRMRRMNIRFAFAPILFIKYDKTTPESRAAAESRLETIGMLETARRDDGLRKVILYDARTRDQIDIIHASDPIPVIRRKIATGLKRGA